MPIVHLLRHGHVHNPDHILYGRLPNYRLSDAGQEMARVAADYFVKEGRDVARIVSSPLLRAQQTARALKDVYGLPIETDDRLIESANSFEGVKVRPIAKWLLHPRRLWSVRNPFRPSWGEPYAEIRDRMMAAVLDAARVEPVRETVLVSHQLPIWVARLAAEGRRLAHHPQRRTCALASVTSLRIEGGKVVGVEYSTPASHIPVPR
jgi:broad specificity phosphatase PhoE